MRKDQLVLILVKYKDENGVEKQRTGTGYFIGPNLVLTAYHVLSTLKCDQIKVRIESNIRWIEADNDPAWRSESLDAALIITKERLETPEWQEIKWQQREFDTIKVEWESLGYPEGASKERDGKTYYSSKPLYGEGGVSGGQVDTKKLHLTVKSIPNDPGNWRGISGSPVFVGGEFAGIITNVPENFSKDLSGTPAFELFMDADFRAVIEKEYILSKNKKWALILIAENTIEEELLRHAGAAVLEYYNPPKDDEWLKVEEDGDGADGAEVIHAKDGEAVADDKNEGNADVVSVKISTVLKSPSSLLNFVELVCKAPIMIIDATDFQPGIMLLMGIRGVVRRGTTITLTTKRIAESDLSKIPFNIQQIKLISLDEKSYENNSMSSKDRIIDAIKEGITQLEINPNYLDLPPFDAVRNPIVAELLESKYDIKALGQKTLFLCPFDENYMPAFRYLHNQLATLVGRTENLVRMLDINLPQLVGQSLHEHIRWSKHCVIDWTGWLPNVFYELGVRLAASDKGPVNLIESKEIELVSAVDLKKDYAKEQKRLLIGLFDTFQYTFIEIKEETTNKIIDEKKEFPGQQIKAYLNFIKNTNRSGSQNKDDSKIFHSHIHDIATKHFDFKQQKLEIPPHENIRRKIEREVGKDRSTSGKSNILFSKGNKEFRKAFENNIQENWLCAWFYFLHRYTWKDFKTDEKKRKELISLGDAVTDSLVTDDYKFFKDRILKITNKLRKIDVPLLN